MKLAIAAIVSLLAITPAMAVDFTQQIKNIDGSPVTDKDGKALDQQPTLSSICVSALLAQYADERDNMGKETIGPEEKFHRFKLALKVSGDNQKDVTLTPEELTMLKNLVGKAYSPLIVGQAWQQLGVK